MSRALVFLAALGMAACAAVPEAPQQSLDDAARDYVRLVLEIDAHEPGYVDAYFGPPDLRETARRSPRDQAALKREADRLHELIASYRIADPDEARRSRVLAVNVASARFRLDMIGGVRAKFADEAEKLFGLRPRLKSLSSYDAALARIEAIVPGPGTLADRVSAFRSAFAIPDDRLAPVMDAAIAECRRRTLEHIELPESESFSMEMVKGKSWGAYNYYKGDNRSLIQINTDLPVSIGNALVLGCHEGYPGHHVQGIFTERAYKSKGWAEYSVVPLYVPAAPLNEGGADYGVDLAFPGEDRLRFEAGVLYPLAGLDPSKAAAFDALRKATAELDGAALTITQMYLDGVNDRSRTVDLIQKYELVTRDVAEQSLEFDEEYRSYTINYASGEDLVRAFVERAGPDADARWKAYVRILSSANRAGGPCRTRRLSETLERARAPRHDVAERGHDAGHPAGRRGRSGADPVGLRGQWRAGASCHGKARNAGCARGPSR